MNKFNEVYMKIIHEQTDDSFMKKFFRWNKGEVTVYAHMVTDDDIDLCNDFIAQCRENIGMKAKPGRYLVYNPNIPKKDGQVWMNKLSGYEKVPGTITKDGLTFEKYHYTPKEGNLEEGTDTWIGIRIPEGVTFKIPDGLGNNGSDGSTAYGTDWLPIVNGKFDWARSEASMKQSNFINVGQETPSIDEECLAELKKLFKK